MTKHTPAKMKLMLQRHVGGFYLIKTVNGSSKRISKLLHNEDVEDAKHIVKCVNNHDTLKAKADLCDEVVEALEGVNNHLITLGYEGSDAFKIARRVLYKIKGE